MTAIQIHHARGAADGPREVVARSNRVGGCVVSLVAVEAAATRTATAPLTDARRGDLESPRWGVIA